MYNETKKNISRTTLLNHAIDSLTSKRSDSFIVNFPYIKKIVKHIGKIYTKYCISNYSDVLKFNNEIDEQLNIWKSYFKSFQIPKKPKDLKVLYLSGPQPINDLTVLTERGVSPFNIWAIENDHKTYKEAVKNLFNVQFPIKLFEGNATEFFEKINESFDIIYYDACSPLISKNQNPLNALKSIFALGRLNPLSVLITNFSEITDNEDQWKKIIFSWNSVLLDHNCSESIYNFIDYGNLEDFDFSEIKKIELEDLNILYSDFLSSFIPILANQFISSWSSINSQNSRNYFFSRDTNGLSNLDKFLSDINQINDIKELYNRYSLPILSPRTQLFWTWARYISNELPSSHPLNIFLDKKENDRIPIKYALAIHAIMHNFYNSDGEKNDPMEIIGTKEFKNFIKSSQFFDYHLRLTTDIPMPNLMLDLFWGIMGRPYIINPNCSIAHKYKAKTNTMYSNLFVFDQARYFFDLLPTLPLIPSLFNGNKAIQLIIRGQIDQILKNNSSVNSQYFWGGTMESAKPFNVFGNRIERYEL